MSKEMNRREFMKTSAAAGTGLVTGSVSLAFAEEKRAIQLLKPQAGSGNALMQLLWKRTSSREFSPEPLPIEVLSNMLWAAFGISRPDGKRTAPTARNRQEIDIYVATAKSLYLYDAKANLLSPLLAEDIRGMTGGQPYVKDAPVNLIYVADYSKMDKGANEERVLFSAAATGFISENVYLYCASEGLATVVRAMIDRPTLAREMKLRPDQSIILAQSVGYPRRRS